MSKRVKESDGSPVSLAKKLADEVDRASSFSRCRCTLPW